MRAAAPSALACCLVVSSATALAETDAAKPRPFGERASTVLVIDDLFAYSKLTEKSDSGSSRGYTALGGAVGGVQILGSTARFGVHFVPGSRITLGAGVQWFHDGQDSATLLGFAPRIGYVVAVGTETSIWIRAGLGYQNWSLSETGGQWHLPAGAEIRLVGAPVDHFGWTFGTMVEVDLDRGATGTASTPRKRTLMTLGFGLLFDL